MSGCSDLEDMSVPAHAKRGKSLSRGSPLSGAAERGFTLTELLVAALVFGVVGLAMGSFLLFTVQREERGIAAAELQRNGSLLMQAVTGSIRAGKSGGVTIPADGELPADPASSVTIRFPAEPYDDENLDGQWNDSGATGLCAPRECFRDLNGNGRWDPEVTSVRSFRLSGGKAQERVGEDGAWMEFLENRYGESSGMSSVRVGLGGGSFVKRSDGNPEDPDVFEILFVISDDMRTPLDSADDIKQEFRQTVRRGG
jgi:prepilin-type N-terminal cleavage/methylation domain-containing protein